MRGEVDRHAQESDEAIQTAKCVPSLLWCPHAHVVWACQNALDGTQSTTPAHATSRDHRRAGSTQQWLTARPSWFSDALVSPAAVPAPDVGTYIRSHSAVFSILLLCCKPPRPSLLYHPENVTPSPARAGSLPLIDYDCLAPSRTLVGFPSSYTLLLSISCASRLRLSLSLIIVFLHARTAFLSIPFFASHSLPVLGPKAS